ncbi:MAG: hypothetical protein HYT20_01625 [Candidatus Nealsonbacteria bacterium]|nr:hypothetical protein [Candidatus Nealsonbacteria bacterium]
MMITERQARLTARQSEILNRIVREYIERAMPVSSQLLEKKHKFGVSPATIRNEMQELADQGYISQPHTSAGRVPTDKGYRFFVDQLLERDMTAQSVHPKPSVRSHITLSHWIEEVTKFLAEESSDLALGYLADEKIIWKEGWQDIFEEPEFLEPGLASSFAGMIDDFEENIEELFLPEIKIYIGKENPVSSNKEFSIITAGFNGGLFAILGPKRMSYDKNIKLIKKLWEKI